MEFNYTGLIAEVVSKEILAKYKNSKKDISDLIELKNLLIALNNHCDFWGLNINDYLMPADDPVYEAYLDETKKDSYEEVKARFEARKKEEEDAAVEIGREGHPIDKSIDLDEVSRLYRLRGSSIDKIAEKLGCNRDSVRWALKELKVR